MKEIGPPLDIYSLLSTFYELKIDRYILFKVGKFYNIKTLA